ncbi:MAG: PBP1A family penicillin-binding protein [Desulfobacterales bacterium]|nr:PBP1A family penicillin-binding protein [Desulfobacterales bacterium]
MTDFSFNKKMIILLVLAAIIPGIMVGAFVGLFRDLPQIRLLEDFKPSAVTRIYSSEKRLLAELFIEKRTPVPFEIMPDYLIKALLTTEDRNFYKHSGIDIKGILRAIIKDILAGEFVEGASTITQQLSKTLFLTPQKTLTRKIKEAFLAIQLERRYTKNEILALYLNQIYLGSGTYGVEAAANKYFGKSVENLNLSECAMIASLPKAPSIYSPLVNPDLAKTRRNIVLKQMADTGIISVDAYEKTAAKPVIICKNANQQKSAPYFVDYVSDFLENKIGAAMLYKGGLSVYTTISLDLQNEAEQAVLNGISEIENRMGKKGIISPDPQCALVSIDIQTGGILAMVGGKDYSKSQFNRASNALRQPGSAFKPVIYAQAIERGFSQNKTILDGPVIYKNQNNNKDWEPENFSKDFKGEMTLRKALALSKNIPAVKLIEMLGPSSTVTFAHKLGITSTLSPNLSLALGTSEVNLLELTAVYSTFPNLGKHITPYGIIEVVDRSGRVIWRIKPEQKVAMSPGGAAVITDMLQGVILHGTGKKAKVLNRPVGGKTGTTNFFRDALFVGFSPAIATGVWVGNDDFTTLGEFETGGKAALPIWIEFMKQTLKNKPYQTFDLPDTVISAPIDLSSGLRTSIEEHNSVEALFIKGNEPD